MHYKKQPTNKLKSGWVPWPKESRGEAEEIEAGRQVGRAAVVSYQRSHSTWAGRGEKQFGKGGG